MRGGGIAYWPTLQDALGEKSDQCLKRTVLPAALTRNEWQWATTSHLCRDRPVYTPYCI